MTIKNTIKSVMLFICLLLIVIAMGFLANADDIITTEQTNNDGIPTLFINCDKTVEQLNETKGNVGVGTYKLIDGEGAEKASGDLSSIKGRGNSSWNFCVDKKSYNIKIDKKAEGIC